MLVEDMQPISSVERSGFQKFCTQVAPYCTIPSRRTLNRRLQCLYEMTRNETIEAFQKAKWMSATADAWSAHKRAYMGVTVHYVNQETLHLESVSLCCRRFRNAHTGEAIAKMLLEILEEFNIVQKMQNIVTDNAANFAKAFKMKLPTRATTANNDSCVDQQEANVEAEEDVDADYDESVESVEITELLNETDFESETGYMLPQHKRCGNHTLNLIASSDALKARDDDAKYRKTYDRVMGKVQALSNAVNRSPKNADIVADITGSTFLRPTVTRWCSDYYAVNRVVAIGIDNVNKCLQSFSLLPFSEKDFSFLKSYIKVMKPVVVGMDLMQSESCFIGHLVPTILGINSKLSEHTDRTILPLVNALIAGINKRFGDIVKDNEHLIASALIPQFKLNFLSDEMLKVHVRNRLLLYLQEVEKECNPQQGKARYIIALMDFRNCNICYQCFRFVMLFKIILFLYFKLKLLAISFEVNLWFHSSVCTFSYIQLKCVK